MKYLFVIVLLLSCTTVHKTRYEFGGTPNGNSPTSHFIFNSDGYLIEVDSFANDGSKWVQFMQQNCQPSLRLCDTENTVRPTVVIYPAKKITVDSNYFMHPEPLSVLPNDWYSSPITNDAFYNEPLAYYNSKDWHSNIVTLDSIGTDSLHWSKSITNKDSLIRLIIRRWESHIDTIFILPYRPLPTWNYCDGVTDDIRKRLTHTVYDTTKDDSVFFINHKPIPQ